jgi:O-antigen/teichoic acid export membrane protein
MWQRTCREALFAFSMSDNMTNLAASGREIPLPARHSLLRERVIRWGNLFSVFFAGQLLVQAIGLVTGFLLIRWLSVESYAQFSVAFGFQSTLSTLADLGFCGSMVALAGARGTQPEVLGRYISAAKYYRGLILSILFPLTMVAFPILMAKHGWNWGIQAALLASILCSVVAQGYLSLYSAPLLIHQKLKRSYGIQAVAATSRLGLNAILHAVSALASATASWAATVATIVCVALFRRSVTGLVKEPPHSDAETRKEMLRFIAPFIPGIIFTAFQGQITVFLITLFGTTKAIAEVGALGRLGQVLLVFGGLNAVIVEPYIARLPHHLLLRRYGQILTVAILVMAAITAAAFAWPDLLLLVLGHKYQHLRRQASWSIVTWCISYIGGLLWTMHAARRWVFWWNSTLYIVTLLVVQVIAIMFFDLSTTMNVIFFNVFISFAALSVHITAAFYGFSHDERISASRRAIRVDADEL